MLVSILIIWKKSQSTFNLPTYSIMYNSLEYILTFADALQSSSLNVNERYYRTLCEDE